MCIPKLRYLLKRLETKSIRCQNELLKIKRENQTDSLLMYIISSFKNTHSHISVMNREDRIRTCDTLVPNQVLYQAELLPELNRKMHPRGVEPLTA